MNLRLNFWKYNGKLIFGSFILTREGLFFSPLLFLHGVDMAASSRSTCPTSYIYITLATFRLDGARDLSRAFQTLFKYFLLTRFKPISLSPIFFITGQQQGGSFFLFSISYTFGYLSSIQTLNFNSFYVTKGIRKASANILCVETIKGCKTVELKPYSTMISWTYISKKIFFVSYQCSRTISEFD